MSRSDESFFAFHVYKNELSRVLERLNHVIEDTVDFWKFVQKYEEVERKRPMASTRNTNAPCSSKSIGKSS